jgi:hypothetical protein
MAYATTTQIQYAAGGVERLNQLADFAGDTNATEIANAIADAQARAEAWMHDKLRRRYLVPLQNLTAEGAATLARLSAEETVYRLRLARQLADQADIESHKERERELEALATGVSLVDDPAPAKSSAAVAGIVENDGPVSRRGLKGTFW